MALSGATIPGQSGPESNGNEGVVRIPQSSSIAGASPSDRLVSYQDTHYPSAEKQLVYSSTPADWAMKFRTDNIDFIRNYKIIISLTITGMGFWYFSKKKRWHT